MNLTCCLIHRWCPVLVNKIKCDLHIYVKTSVEFTAEEKKGKQIWGYKVADIGAQSSMCACNLFLPTDTLTGKPGVIQKNTVKALELIKGYELLPEL